MIHRHKKERGFVTLDKTALNDHGLSWAAKGLHSYLMGLPDDWRVNLVDLSQRSKSAKAATTTAMDELIAAGYVFRQKVIAAGNRFAGYQYQMFETPIEAENWKSANGISVVGKPDYGKPEHGESEYGKPRTNKNTGTKELIEVSIEEVSNEGDAPAHFDDVSKKVSKGKPVVDFVPDSLLEVEITGADAPKSRKAKTGNEPGLPRHRYLTPAERWPAENMGLDGGWEAKKPAQVFADWFEATHRAKFPTITRPGMELLFGKMQEYAINSGNVRIKKAGGYVWEDAITHTWLDTPEKVRQYSIFATSTPTVKQQVKILQDAGYEPTQKEIAAAQWKEMQERNAAKGGPRT